MEKTLDELKSDLRLRAESERRAKNAEQSLRDRLKKNGFRVVRDIGYMGNRIHYIYKKTKGFKGLFDIFRYGSTHGEAIDGLSSDGKLYPIGNEKDLEMLYDVYYTNKGSKI